MNGIWLMVLVSSISAVLSALIRRWLGTKELTSREKEKLNKVIYKARKLENLAVNMGCVCGGESDDDQDDELRLLRI